MNLGYYILTHSLLFFKRLNKKLLRLHTNYMKKLVILTTLLVAMCCGGLAGCSQNSSSQNLRQPNIEQTKEDTVTHKRDGEQMPVSPDNSPENLPDGCPDGCPDKYPDGCPEKRFHMHDRLPKKIGTFGFVLIMPSPHDSGKIDQTKLPSVDEEQVEPQN